MKRGLCRAGGTGVGRGQRRRRDAGDGEWLRHGGDVDHEFDGGPFTSSTLLEKASLAGNDGCGSD